MLTLKNVKAKKMDDLLADITINGKKVTLKEYVEHSIKNETNVQFIQETSEGLDIVIAEHNPVNLKEVTSITEHMYPKYRVYMNGVDSGKSFNSKQDAQNFTFMHQSGKKHIMMYNLNLQERFFQ